MKRSFAAFFIYIACAGSFFGSAFGAPVVVHAQEPTPLNREDIVALTKPSVVRIIQRVRGSATIPALKIDLRDRSVSVDTSRPEQKIPIDETLSGSGFIVSSDGYVVTNSHVVSLSTTKINVMTDVVLPAMYESAFSLNPEEADKFFQDENATFEFSKKVFQYVSEHSVFDVRQEIVVLNPSSDKERLDDLITEGIPVRTVSVNDNFYEDDRDVALIKIDQSDLPTIPLGDSENLSVGKQISIFGFPATAEFNQRNPLESTFTQGVISALKDSEKRDFKVFQTDAKVSAGSSGGPLVDENGRVLGIVTFQTDQLQNASGDNFAFAIPIEIAKTMIEDAQVSIQPSAYERDFKQGLGFLHEKHCIDAVRAFDNLKKGNPVFGVDRYVDPYIARCQLLTSSGQSIDTVQSRFKNFVGGIAPSMWLAIGIVVVFAFSLCFIIWWLIREVNKEERAIRTLEERMSEEEKKVYSDRRSTRRVVGRKET